MRTCGVILAGGRGSRSADSTVPKVAQEIGGKSLLEWQLELVEQTDIEQVFVVTGHLGLEVKHLLESIHAKDVKVEIIHEESPQGTVNALKEVARKSDFDTFVVLLGDVLASLPLQAFLDSFRASENGVGVVVHPSTHPEDSDLVFQNHAGTALVSSKGSRLVGIPNMASAGMFIVTSSAIARYPEARDIGSDLLAVAAEANDLFVYISSHYLKDTGTPDRLSRAKADASSGVFERRGNKLPRPVIFLDRDGVLNPVQPEIYHAADYHLTQGVAEAIFEVNGSGIPAIVVTNQPGIAKGLMTFETHEAIRARLDSQLASEGAFVDDYFYCPHHPDSGFEGEVSGLKIECECRKPGAGMALAAALRHGIDLQRSYVIGDTARDLGLAKALKANFVHVTRRCELQGEHMCFADTNNAIRHARMELIC